MGVQLLLKERRKDRQSSLGAEKTWSDTKGSVGMFDDGEIRNAGEDA
jgi:hypothetical protein